VQLSVVIAPDSFKGSLPAGEVAEAIAAGWAEVRPADAIALLPQADGGEGTMAAIAAAATGARLRDAGPVRGPDGRPVPGAWLELPGGIGVVELAQPSGLPLMAEPDPLGATTAGLGEVIRNALGSGIRSLVIGLGGSASTDGAAGALSALGLRLLDEAGRAIDAGGGGLARLARIDASRLLPPPPGGVTVLTDVTAPLTGPEGAAARFGPQKGAAPEQVRLLDAALSRFASLAGGDPGMPGSGAAGGAGYGFRTFWGAAIEPGAAFIAGISGLRSAVETADVVLTGEGRFDATSVRGKVVGELVRAASAHRVGLGIVAGQLAATALDAAEAESRQPIWCFSLTEHCGSAEQAIARPRPALREAGRAAARHFGEWVSRKA